MSAGFFDTFRTLPFPTLYGPMKTPVTADVLEAGLIFAIAILAVSFLVILPGLILKKRLLFLVKVVVGLFILAAIFLCNFGQEWEVAELHTKTPYKAGVRHEINADIGVKIGLRSVNITLKAGDDHYTVHFPKSNETVNFNERFSWDDLGWPQGRGGFGPFAGLIQREFRAAQLKGLPYPILWIAEYFTPDGEGIRWGRYYRQAGYYSHIMLWLAFPLYILSLILVMMVRNYGGVFFTFTGLSMITANLIFGFVRNPTDLTVPFEDGALHFKWGWCFWLCLITGILNLLIGLIILILDCFAPDMLHEILDIDVAGEYDQCFISEEELARLGIKVQDGTRPMASTPGGPPTSETLRYGYRRKTTKMQKLVGTMKLTQGVTKRNKMPAFVQQMNDMNGSAVRRTPVVPTLESYAFDNRGAEMSLDDLAVTTPDPDDMRGLNIDATHPDMDNYDNAAKAKQYLNERH